MTDILQNDPRPEWGYVPLHPSIDQLAGALAAAQGEFEPVTKDGHNPHYKSSYASLDSAIKTNKTVLAKHGLAVSQLIGFDEHGETLTTRLMHKSGQSETSVMRMHLQKNDPQGQGSAITYARRQAFLAITGMAPGDDNDAEPSSRPRQAPNPAAQAVRAAAAAVDVATGEIRRREPPHPKTEEGYVPALTAKKMLLEELALRGIGEDAAKATAKEMWGTRGSNPIQQVELDGLVESLGPVQLFDDEAPFSD